MRPASLRGALAGLRERLERADHVLLALDFDGTLAPICAHHDQASIPPETLAALHQLTQSDRLTVAILSGRSLADLKQRLDIDAVYAGNHGLEIEGRGFCFVHEGANALRNSIDQACWDLEAAFYAVPGIVIERKGLTATVHHRQAPRALAGWIEATTRLVLQPYGLALRLSPALQAWEIRPRIAWNKGSALRFLIGKMNVPDPLLVCAGDDLTDEDMYDSWPDAISIKVGSGLPTRARYRAAGPAELFEFLDCMRYSVVPGAEQTGFHELPLPRPAG